MPLVAGRDVGTASAAELAAADARCEQVELTAAVGKTKSGELGNWKGIRLDFLDNVPADVRRVSPNYLDMLACKDELDALRRAGKLRRKPTHDPAFADEPGSVLEWP